MERAGEVIKVESKPMRLLMNGRSLDQTRIFGKLANERDFAFIGQLVEMRSHAAPVEIGKPKLVCGLTENRMATCGSILHVKDRIVLGLFRHLGKIKIQR